MVRRSMTKYLMILGAGESKRSSSKTWMVSGGLRLGVLLFLAVLLPISLTLEDTKANEDPMAVAQRVLSQVPLIDG